MPKNKINEFLQLAIGELNKCVVCLRDDFLDINQCHQCSASYCGHGECLISALHNYTLHKFNIKKTPIKCMLCIYTNGHLIIE